MINYQHIFFNYLIEIIRFKTSWLIPIVLKISILLMILLNVLMVLIMRFFYIQANLTNNIMLCLQLKNYKEKEFKKINKVLRSINIQNLHNLIWCSPTLLIIIKLKPKIWIWWQIAKKLKNMDLKIFYIKSPFKKLHILLLIIIISNLDFWSYILNFFFN